MRIAALLGAVVLGCLTVAGPAGAQTTDVPSGQTLYAVMQTPLDSKTANVGDRFTMNVVQPFPSGSDLTGASVFGHVAGVVRAGLGTRPRLELAFDRLAYADGSSVELQASLVSLQTKADTRNPFKLAGQTLAGMFVGNAVFKTLFHAAGGGVLGAVGGLVLALNVKSDVHISEGAEAQLTLAEPIRARRQAAE